MKKLQSNFTTPEQSKRLLELGVPVKSANCYYMIICAKIDRQIEVIYDFDAFYNSNKYLKDYFPCWSVGRLIEIIGICAGIECVDFETLAWTEGIWSEKLIRLIEDLAKYDKLDFSKLEE